MADRTVQGARNPKTPTRRSSILAGRFPFDKFVRYYPFNEINRAIEDQRNGSAIKPILEVSVA